MIETRLLRYFLAIAAEQNITRAAEYLNISQPSLSKQMMDLEAQLGCTLFIRGKKRITLTEDGVYLEQRAQEIIDLIEKTESAFHQQEKNIVGDIYIGCGEFRSCIQLMELVQEFQRDNPAVHFHFISGNADSLIERLDKGLCDFAFLIEPAINDRYEYIKLNLTETYGLLMRKDSELAALESIPDERLGSIPLIMSAQSFTNNNTVAPLVDIMKRSNNAPVATYNLIYNAALMVEAGIGYAIGLPDLVYEGEESPLTFRPFTSGLSGRIYLVHKRLQAFSRATIAFLERLNVLYA